MTQLQSGSVLGKYELLVRIGRGGMASVWVARERAPQSGRQRLVAVKAMLPELAQQTTFRSMFLEEGQLVRSIDHENVVQIHDVSEVSGILCMAMEWVEGESLRNVIRAATGRRPIPAEIAVQVVSDAAAGLHAAHELRGWDGELRGIVHCDVSPHNILLGVDGRAKIVDFGVASALGHLDQQGVKGKPGYMSPEQARGEPFDRRSDVYALGIVLFELTTGTPFIPSRDRNEALQMAADPLITRPTAVNPAFPPRLEPVILTALQADPSQRYQTTQEFQLALQRFLVDEAILVSGAGISRLLRKVVGERIERRRELLANVLRETDGDLAGELVAQHPGLANSRLWDYHGDNVPSGPISSRSAYPAVVSSPVSARSSTLASAEPISEVDADLGSGIPVRPGNTSAPPTRRGINTLLVFTLVIVAVGAALVVGFLLRDRLVPATAQPATAVAPPPQRDAANSNGSTRPGAPEADAEGVDLESLPVERARPTAKPTAAARRRAQKAPVAKGSAKAPAPPATAGAERVVGDDEEVDLTPKWGNSPGGEAQQPAAQAADASGFSRGAASAALVRAAASAGGCSNPEGVTGSGTATVTFAPSGSVQAVRLPFKFSGTTVGRCIDGKFRSVKISAFDGGARSLSQSFTISN